MRIKYLDPDGVNQTQDAAGDARQEFNSSGAAKTESQASSLNAYGPRSRTLGDRIVGIPQSDATTPIYRSPDDIKQINNVSIDCLVGTVAIDVTSDSWVTYRRVPITAISAGGVPTANAVQLVAGERGVLTEDDIGKFTAFQIVWIATADANADGFYGVS